MNLSEPGMKGWERAFYTRKVGSMDELPGVGEYNVDWNWTDGEGERGPGGARLEAKGERRLGPSSSTIPCQLIANAIVFKATHLVSSSCARFNHQ